MLYQKTTEWLQTQSARTKCLLIIGLAGFLALVAHFQRPSEALERAPELATFIPAGKSLLDIEIINYESLDSFLGNYGVVDLFGQNQKGEMAAEPVAQQVKVLRSSKKPSLVGVVASDPEVKSIAQHGRVFYAVIRNPKNSGEQVVKPYHQKRLKIIVEDQK